MLADVEPPILWRERGNVQLAADHLLTLLADHDDLDAATLATDPAAALSDCEHVALISVDDPQTGCGLFGSYSSSPPTIRYNPSRNRERNNFTILHELGHHVQRNDRGWAFNVLARVPPFDRKLLEEDVSNAFASKVLIPDELVSGLGSNVDSEFVNTIYQKSSASRRAAAVRAEGLAGDAVLLLAIVDVVGTVQFSTSTSSELPMLPSRSIQPDLARLVKDAVRTGRTARGRTQDGLRYSSGSARSDLSIDVTIDNSGLTAFAAIRPVYQFGDRDWGQSERECNSEACGEIFTWDADAIVCLTCNEPRCPVCSTCGCERPSVGVCQECQMELSMADVAAERTTHDYC